MGKAHVYGDNINTDLIIAGKHTKTKNCEELAAHCLEDLDATFREKVKKGDVLVAGCNFGCGSSREQAPLALKSSGLVAILAKSYARIFYRNAINIGLPAVICDISRINPGDDITVDFNRGIIVINGSETIPCQAFSPIMQSILSAGGLTAYLNEHGSFQETIM